MKIKSLQNVSDASKVSLNDWRCLTENSDFQSKHIKPFKRKLKEEEEEEEENKLLSSGFSLHGQKAEEMAQSQS